VKVNEPPEPALAARSDRHRRQVGAEQRDGQTALGHQQRPDVGEHEREDRDAEQRDHEAETEREAGDEPHEVRDAERKPEQMMGQLRPATGRDERPQRDAPVRVGFKGRVHAIRIVSRRPILGRVSLRLEVEASLST
jgi:hypothetical protein